MKANLMKILKIARYAFYIAFITLIMAFPDLLKTLALKILANPSFFSGMFSSLAINVAVVLFLICIELFFVFFETIKTFFLEHEIKIYKLTILFFLALNIILKFSVPIYVDDAQHARAAFLVSQGKVPYIDFFETHNPLYWYLIAPLFLILNGFTAIYALYLLSFAILVTTCFFLFKIGKVLYIKKSSPFLLVILFLSFRHVLISYEIRADIFSALLMIITLYYLLSEKPKYFLLGFLMGISFLFLQKAVLYITAIALVIFLSDYKILYNLKRKSYFLLGVLSPIMIFILLFFRQNGFQGIKQYFIMTFLLNLNFSNFYNNNIIQMLSATFATNGFHILLGLLGLVLLISKIKIQNWKKIILLCIFNLFIIFYFISKNHLYSQDYLYFVPFLAVPAVPALLFLFRKIRANWHPYISAIALVFIVLIPTASILFNLLIPGEAAAVSFYLNNFKDEPTNCNFIYNPYIEYHWLFVTDSKYLISNSRELLQKYGIPTDYISMDEFIYKETKIICASNNEEENKLIENGYAHVRLNSYKGDRLKIYYKK